MNGLFDQTLPFPRAPVPPVAEAAGTDFPAQIGPYRILASIGRGGMGAVYRAQDPQSGQMVALKTVLLPRRELLQSLRREILALARLEHPGIVKVVAHGVEGGLPWYAMELVEGLSLGQYASETRGGRTAAAQPTLTMMKSAATEALERSAVSDLWSEALEGRTQLEMGTGAASPAETSGAAPAAASGAPSEGAVRRILGVARRLCQALGYLHGEGIVHRDLKPGNVMVRPDGMPVIVDFGLAADSPFAKLGEAGEAGLESRERLETGGLGAGTVAYMAPEQKAGELVDARADLYALGAILYELITGRRLFGSKGLARQPGWGDAAGTGLPEGWEVPLPERLRPLLRGLLAREPRRRIGYASVVAAALSELGTEEDLGAWGPPSRAYLYRPGFIGRQGPLRQIEQVLAEAEGGRGRLILLEGESGTGKTRLAMELCAQAAQRGAEVLIGECGAGGSGSAASAGEVLQALKRPLRALADRCREAGEAETQRLFGTRAKLLALYEPSLRELPGVEALPEPPELPPQAARRRLFAALSQTLSALAEAGLVVLVLDDLQWADELTMGFVDHLAGVGALESRRVLLVGTVRSEEMPEPVKAFAKKPQVRELRLEKLDGAEIGALVQDMLALAEAPGLFVGFLASKSEGNPLFIAEYLRSAVAQRVLYQDDAGRWCVAEPQGIGAGEDPYEGLGLPLSVRGLMEGRLRVLGEGARRVAEMAAVLGREAPERLLFEMAGKLLGEALGAVEELMVREVLEELRDEPGLAEVEGGRGLPLAAAQGRGFSGAEDARRLTSTEAGSARAPHSVADRSPAHGLGARFRFMHEQLRQVVYQGIEPERLAPLHRAAAEVIEPLPAAERARFLGALGFHWEQAGDPLRASAAYLPAADAALKRSAMDEAERLYRAYLRLTGAATAESVTTLRRFGFRVLHRLGKNVEAIEALWRSVEAARALGLKDAEILGLGDLGKMYSLTQEPDQAIRLLEDALAVEREVGHPEMRCEALNTLGNIHITLGATERAREYYQQSLELAVVLEDVESQTLARCNLAMAVQFEGRWAEARDGYEQALALTRQSGDRRVEAAVLSNFGVLLRTLGDLQQAEPVHRQALAIQRELDDRRNEIFSIFGLGDIFHEQGKLAEARVLFEQVLAFGREAREGHICAFSSNSLAEVLLDQGEVQRAREILGPSIQDGVAEASGPLKAHARMILARLERLDSGDFDAVAGLLDQVTGLLQGQHVSAEEVRLTCQRGHLALAQGLSAAEPVLRAREQVQALGYPPSSFCSVLVDLLAEAQAAWLAGRPLFRGELPERIPAALRRKLLPAAP